MGREDQTEEREVLDSIFPEEITDISDTSYRISITLDSPENDEQSADAEPPILLLQVSYPEEYPDVAPDLELSAPPNAPKHPRLDISEDRERLLEALQPTIEENMGMAMVFTLVSALKESAELLMAERVNAVHAVMEMEAAQAEEEENRKFQGTTVNRETFLEWLNNFKKEMEEEERRRKEEKEAEDKKGTKKGPAKEEKKLTGKQLWERGLAGKADFDEEDEDAMPAAVEKMKIAA
ncbi:RWD domain-containing protein [Aspergillus venezuelensis]